MPIENNNGRGWNFTLTTVEDLRDVVGKMKHLCGPNDDPQALHGLQDQVYVEVLKACSLGRTDMMELARVALEIDDLPFSRWYA